MDLSWLTPALLIHLAAWFGPLAVLGIAYARWGAR